MGWMGDETGNRRVSSQCGTLVPLSETVEDDAGTPKDQSNAKRNENAKQMEWRVCGLFFFLVLTQNTHRAQRNVGKVDCACEMARVVVICALEHW